jgi:hypothetical protein
MKRIVYLLLISFIILQMTSCKESNGATTSNSQLKSSSNISTSSITGVNSSIISTPETLMNDDGTGLLYLGMTYDSFTKIAEKYKWSVVVLGKNYVGINSISVDCNSEQGFSADFTLNNLLCSIWFQAGFKTSKGIKGGDTLEKVIKLYGKPDKIYTYDIPYAWEYKYYFKNNYSLNIGIGRYGNATVIDWSIQDDNQPGYKDNPTV